LDERTAARRNPAEIIRSWNRSISGDANGHVVDRASKRAEAMRYFRALKGLEDGSDTMADARERP
jgi:hypothetical protein